MSSFCERFVKVAHELAFYEFPPDLIVVVALIYICDYYCSF